MKVINFNPSDFEVYLQTIVDDIMHETTSILVIGVREGGLPIARMVYEHLSIKNDLKVDYAEVLCQRPTTKIKKKNLQRERFVKSIFRITPEVVLNQMRLAEHHLITSKKVNVFRSISVQEPLKLDLYDLVLIVDDAVDTGYSMAEILKYLQCLNENVRIKTLSAVVTKKNPVLIPDYFYYRDVLIRFPWSLDAK